MLFELPSYRHPDFSVEPLKSSPDMQTLPVVKEGVAPLNFHATSIFPEYFKINNRWVLLRESRMDCAVVVKEDYRLEVKEFRRLHVGEQVVVGRVDDGSIGIYVHTEGFKGDRKQGEAFTFRTGRSRETSFSRDYDRLYDLLRFERENGYIVWVLGPAIVFDQDSRVAMVSLIKNGYANVVFAGNALATHDLEGAVFKTALGQSIYTQVSMPGGHYHHLDVINQARSYDSLGKYVKEEHILDGVVHACVENNVPLVLAGSIRDDGPLPDVVPDVYRAQMIMREHTKKATTVIGLATQLHSIATGNMTPSYQVVGENIRPVFIYSVDISEFAVNKLRDRGTLEVTSIVSNVQDFLVNVERNLVGK
ncbi:MAG: hypothetical protein N2645_17900 [Clostridia bacterium]|nr:hypothetical protein [Clostridia bacterium]